MPVTKLSEREERKAKKKLHRREAIRTIIAERGLTDVFRIHADFIEKAEGQPQGAAMAQEPDNAQSQPVWRKVLEKGVDRFFDVCGSIAGASYLITNAANTGGASYLNVGYFAGGTPGFINAVPDTYKHVKKMTKEWDGQSHYERYKDVKDLIGKLNGVAGNTRNMVLQGAEVFAGVTWNSPGITTTIYDETPSINPAQLEADIAFNIIGNSLAAIGGIEQIVESSRNKSRMKTAKNSVSQELMESVEQINNSIADEQIDEILRSIKDSQTEKFIPAMERMLQTLQILSETEGLEGEALNDIATAKQFIQENIASFEEADKLVRAYIMGARQANFDTACGVFDIINGALGVAVVSSRFVYGPMGGIAGLVNGLSSVTGNALLRGKFFGFEECWDGKSIWGQRNSRKAATGEMEAALSLYGDRDLDHESATRQLVEEIIMEYNVRNPENSVEINDRTRRSFASKIYFEMGSVERTKAGLGNNAIILRAAELRSAAMSEVSDDGIYHSAIRGLNLKIKDNNLPSVQDIAARMGCNRNWRDLVKQSEIDRKGKKWAQKMSADQDAGADTAMVRAAKDQVLRGLEKVSDKRKLGRDIYLRQRMRASAIAETVESPEEEIAQELQQISIEPITASTLTNSESISAEPEAIGASGGSEPISNTRSRIVRRPAIRAGDKKSSPALLNEETVLRMLMKAPNTPITEPGFSRQRGIRSRSGERIVLLPALTNPESISAEPEAIGASGGSEPISNTRSRIVRRPAIRAGDKKSSPALLDEETVSRMLLEAPITPITEPGFSCQGGIRSRSGERRVLLPALTNPESIPEEEEIMV